MKEALLQQIIEKKSQKYLFFPLDFGFYKKPTSELLNIKKLLNDLCINKIGTPMLHKGLVKTFRKGLDESKLPFFMQITGSTGLYKTIEKVQIASVREAKELGALGVSTLIYLGNPIELKMLEMLAKISESADKEGLLLYTMMYVADFKQGEFKEDLTLESIKYAARIAYELGVDIVETRLPEDSENYKEIKELCPIPLIIGDRSSYSDEEYSRKTKLAISNGYDGISISARSLNCMPQNLYSQTLEAFV